MMNLVIMSRWRPAKRNGNRRPTNRHPITTALQSPTLIKGFLYDSRFFFLGTHTHTQRERVWKCAVGYNQTQRGKMTARDSQNLCKKMMKVSSSFDIQLERTCAAPSSTLSIYCGRNNWRENKKQKQKTKQHSTFEYAHIPLTIHTHEWPLKTGSIIFIVSHAQHRSTGNTQSCRRSWKPIRSKEKK